MKHLVELHGGTVAAESEGPNQGATFTVNLPLSSVHSMTELARATARDAVSPRELEGLRVLVVDDDLEARDLVAEILSNAGVSVRTAASAAEAMHEIEIFTPDVLVCDIGMPGTDGFAPMQRIRALPHERQSGFSCRHPVGS